MPKRKRSTEDLVLEQLATGRTDLFRALKTAKGFERQRLAKRIRDDTSAPAKVQRLEREVLVLKSLDLHQVAHAHIISSVLKIKAAAESENLPEDIKRGVGKPDLPEDERAALHNVTSSLYNRPEVRKVVEKAVAGICAALGVEMPSKKSKGKKESKAGREDAKKGEQPADRRKERPENLAARRPIASDDEGNPGQDEATSEEEFAGFSDEDAEEAALSRFDSLLGGSSDEDGEDDYDDIIGDGPSSDQDSEEDDISLADSVSISVSADDDDDESRSPPPKRQATKQAKPAKPSRPGESTFLPTLMGGYVDDSDSEASDLEKEFKPRKNRRGQKERQAIWEKKYRDQARHLQKQKDERNAGWDMKRGAVGDDNKPWKSGVRNPFRQDREKDAQAEAPRQQPAKDKQLTGTLHPSWDAARKAKEKEKNAKFLGKKVVFS